MYIVSDTVVDFCGLIVVQVSQNRVAVVSDPLNKIFIVKNAGFAALSVGGSYKVLDVVDQTRLKCQVTDPNSHAVLGQQEEILKEEILSDGSVNKFVAATL